MPDWPTVVNHLYYNYYLTASCLATGPADVSSTSPRLRKECSRLQFDRAYIPNAPFLTCLLLMRIQKDSIANIFGISESIATKYSYARMIYIDVYISSRPRPGYQRGKNDDIILSKSRKLLLQRSRKVRVDTSTRSRRVRGIRGIYRCIPVTHGEKYW